MFHLQVAVKMTTKAMLNAENLLKVRREIEILKSIKHPNLIQLYQVGLR